MQFTTTSQKVDVLEVNATSRNSAKNQHKIFWLKKNTIKITYC